MRNEPTIEQMNEAIARFMGFDNVRVGYFGCDDETEWQRKHAFWMDKVGIESVGDYIVNVKDDIWFEWNDVAYHREWNWIVPVYKKIKGMHMDILKQSFVMQHIHAAGPMNSAWISVDIDKLHKGIYQFITWLNQQKQNNDNSVTKDKD